MASKKEALFLRLEPDLIGKLKKLSERDDVSLNSYCSGILNESIPKQVGMVHSSYDSIVEDAKDFFGDELIAVILFGSKARGDFTSESDTDFLFVIDKKVKIQREIYADFEKHKKLSDEISIHIINLPDTHDALSGLWCEIALEGIVLFDKGFNVSRFISQIRNLIVRGVYLAKQSHGHRYWTYVAVKESV